MERTHSNKLLISSILVLIVLNLATLTGLWFLIYEKPPAPPIPGNHMPMGGRMFSELNFDAEQNKSSELLQQRHFQNIDSTENELHRLRSLMLIELFKDTPDTTILFDLAMQMGNVQAEFEKNVFIHFLKVKSICRPEQLPTLKTTLTNLVEHMHRRPPPPPIGMPGSGKGFRGGPSTHPEPPPSTR